MPAGDGQVIAGVPLTNVSPTVGTAPAVLFLMNVPVPLITSVFPPGLVGVPSPRFTVPPSISMAGSV
jgi:hypothetical protein